MKKNQLFHILLIALTLTLLMGAVACVPEEEPMETGPITESSTHEENTSEEPTEADTEPAVDSSTDGNVRVILASDLHYTTRETYYFVPAEDRMQHFVDSVLLENELQPIDLLIIVGDTSLDHLFEYGTWTANKVSTTLALREKYLSQIKAAGIPIFTLPGNHEQFNNDQWNQFAGNDRYGAIEVEGNLFIMLDAFSVDLEPNYDNDPSYAKHDVAYIKKQIELHPDCKHIYLVSHHFNYKYETSEFKKLVREDPRIVALFQGHIHTNDIYDMGSEYNNKKLCETGNFSQYWTDGTLEQLKEYFWGYRDLVITPHSAVSRYIVPKYKLAFRGTVLVDTDRFLSKSVKFY